jgi:hypothetical protein
VAQRNRKLCQLRPDGYWELRVFFRKARGQQSPRLLIKCGDCDGALEIYHDPAHPGDLEIGGVFGSTANWREILLPLLAPKAGSPAKTRRGPRRAPVRAFVRPGFDAP